MIYYAAKSWGARETGLWWRRAHLPTYSNSSFNAIPLWERHCWHTRANLWRKREQLHDLISEYMKPYFADTKDLIGTMRSQRVITVTLGVCVGHLMGFRAWCHKGNIKRENLKEQGSFTCSEVHLQQDTQLFCPERPSPSGAPVWPGVDLGGASLINHNVSIG